MADRIAKNPLIFMTLVFMAGIIIGKNILLYPASLIITFCFYLSFLLLKLLHLDLNISTILLLVTLILAGALRYDLATEIQPENQLSQFDLDSIQAITGIVEEVHYRQNNRHTYIVKAISANINNSLKQVSNKILLSTIDITKRFQYGDLIRFNGAIKKPPLQRNPGQFDYRAYLASQDIFYIVQIHLSDSITHLRSDAGNILIQTIISPLKKHCEDSFFIHLNSQTYALLRALILGEKQDLDKDMIRHFQEIIYHVPAVTLI